MTNEKFNQLWEFVIKKSIEKYISKHKEFILAVNMDKFKNIIWNIYEHEYKPKFKDHCMADREGEDEVNGVRIDRHKVAALLYLSIVCNDKFPFLKVEGKRDSDNIFCKTACHEIAYSISLNCMQSFIAVSHNKAPNSQHKANFLNNVSNNGGFKSPDLICEKYNSYKDSIITRMIWATGDYKKLSNASAFTNINMLANIFYFLELHSAS